MKKAIALTILGMLTFGLFGCSTQTYNVDYHGQQDLFKGAKSSYREGIKVKLIYDIIATDTDYSFYVIGADYSTSYDEKQGYIITFTMPANDIEVYVESHNSMIFEMIPSTVFYLVADDEGYTAPDNELSLHAEHLGDYGPLILRCLATNNISEKIESNDSFTLEKLKGDEYVPYDFLGADDSQAITLQPGEEKTIDFDLSKYCDVDEFEEGTYRLSALGCSIIIEIAADWTE